MRFVLIYCIEQSCHVFTLFHTGFFCIVHLCVCHCAVMILWPYHFKMVCNWVSVCSKWALLASVRPGDVVHSHQIWLVQSAASPWSNWLVANTLWPAFDEIWNWLWQWWASRVNLWYFFVVRNIWKDDTSNDEEEEEEESSDITDSEQEEKKVRSRRLPARR